MSLTLGNSTTESQYLNSVQTVNNVLAQLKSSIIFDIANAQELAKATEDKAIQHTIKNLIALKSKWLDDLTRLKLETLEAIPKPRY